MTGTLEFLTRSLKSLRSCTLKVADTTCSCAGTVAYVLLPRIFRIILTPVRCMSYNCLLLIIEVGISGDYVILLCHIIKHAIYVKKFLYLILLMSFYLTYFCRRMNGKMMLHLLIFFFFFFTITYISQALSFKSFLLMKFNAQRYL